MEYKLRIVKLVILNSIRGKVVINATGVFGESIMNMDSAAQEQKRPSIVPSVGTHLVLDEEFHPSEHAILIPKTDDGRVLFAIPWLGKTLVGTTDHQVEAIDLDPRPSLEEIDYLLEHVGRYLTKCPTRADVRSIFAGLRPLVGKSKPRGEATSTSVSTASLSREHEIHVSSSNLISVIGGKWTTYRKMGQDVVDLAVDVGKLTMTDSQTETMRLDQSDTPTDSGQDASGSQDTPLHSRLPYLESDVLHAVRNQMARTVDDVLARRTRALLLDARAAIEVAPSVASLMAQELGWDAARRQKEVDDFVCIAQQYCVPERPL